ncbi:hypothetical protein [Mesorhizobium sp. M0047]|uniref:hypothetical protein n=1 Tax=Mesorhizobium sp. M0047 TaxID=2956859 RepID=UPI003338939E
MQNVILYLRVRIKSVWSAFDSPPAKISCARVDKASALFGRGGFAEDPLPIDAIRRGFDILLFFLRSIRVIHEMKVGRRLPAATKVLQISCQFGSSRKKSWQLLSGLA